ncbi:membrane protein [Aureibacter tunicatorum]|nr:membrane protein [Aureibacter tunicatorum]
MKAVLKKFLMIALASSLMVSSSCIGPFKLTTNLHSWNQQVGTKFINELVFFAFVIVPIYPLSLLGDALIFNSIEFWGGENPISMKEGESEERIVKVKGEKYKVLTTKNRYEIVNLATEEVVEFDYDPETGIWLMTDEEKSMKLVELKKMNKKTVARFFTPNGNSVDYMVDSQGDNMKLGQALAR